MNIVIYWWILHISFFLGIVALWILLIVALWILLNQDETHDRPSNEEGTSHHEDDKRDTA